VKIIYDGLRERGIEECVNLIIVSDHGMAPFGTKQFVQLSEVQY
jgi:predicted AlkP superfamily pyrophosphatase or phosphodiesterase